MATRTRKGEAVQQQPEGLSAELLDLILQRSREIAREELVRLCEVFEQRFHDRVGMATRVEIDAAFAHVRRRIEATLAPDAPADEPEAS